MTVLEDSTIDVDAVLVSNVGGIEGSVFWKCAAAAGLACWVAAWCSFDRKGSRNAGGCAVGLEEMFNALRTREREDTWWDRLC